MVCGDGETLPCVLRGPVDGMPLLILPAFFEEMNRTRRLLARTTARLAEAGVRSWMPDMPGTGDHAEGFEAMDLPRWRAALAALARVAAQGHALHLLAVRGGALLADSIPAASLYRLAPPSSGTALLRDLWRTRAASDIEAGGAETPANLEARSVGGETIEAAGYAIAPTLAAALRAAMLPALALPCRTAATAPGPGVDIVLPGPPPWRQAEPIDEQPLADALAADLLVWMRVPNLNA